MKAVKMPLRIDLSDFPRPTTYDDDPGESERFEVRLKDALMRGEYAEVGAAIRLALGVQTEGDGTLGTELLDGLNLPAITEHLGWVRFGDDAGNFVSDYIAWLAAQVAADEDPRPAANAHLVWLADRFLDTEDSDVQRRLLDEARGMLAPAPSVHEPYVQATLKDFIALATVLVHGERVTEVAPDHWADHLRASYFQSPVVLDNTVNQVRRVIASASSQGPALHVRVALGLMARDRVPIPADWLLAWRFGFESVIWVPAFRLNPEFSRLFAIRLARFRPNGVRVTFPDDAHAITQCRNIEGRTVMLRLPDVPEVTITDECHRTPPEFGSLEHIFRSCRDDLDRLSRLLGKRPEARGTPEALALLPSELAGAAV